MRPILKYFLCCHPTDPVKVNYLPKQFYGCSWKRNLFLFSQKGIAYAVSPFASYSTKQQTNHFLDGHSAANILRERSQYTSIQNLAKQNISQIRNLPRPNKNSYLA